MGPLRTIALPLFFLLLGASVLSSCISSERRESVIRTSVIAGLVASGGGKITVAEATTYRADIQSSWAVAYDPARPPACVPGGLWGDSSGPPTPDRPCNAFVLERRKSRWVVVASGLVGSFVPPSGAPVSLGEPSRLQYLAP